MFQLVQRGIALTPGEKMRAMSTEWANFTKQYEDNYSLIVNCSYHPSFSPLASTNSKHSNSTIPSLRIPTRPHNLHHGPRSPLSKKIQKDNSLTLTPSQPTSPNESPQRRNTRPPLSKTKDKSHIRPLRRPSQTLLHPNHRNPLQNK